MKPENKSEAESEARFQLPPTRDWKPADLGPVLEALQGMRYGSVELFIQDGRLVQIDRKEKIRSFKNGKPTDS